VSQRIGVLDALTAGLTQAIRRPWLLIIPVLVDLGLWLAPQLSIRVLTQRFLTVWETLVRTTYPPDQLAVMEEMLRTVQQALTEIGAQLNLIDVITGAWLGVPSTVAATQATRVTFISDVVLAPAGLSLNLPRVAAAPWRTPPIEITNGWALLLIVAGLWLAGQLLVALYLRWAAVSRPLEQRATMEGEDPWRGGRGFLGLAVRLTVFGLFLGIMIFVLRVPLGLAATLLFLSGNPVAGLLLALIGGITLWLLLWFLTSLFFVSETILLDRQPLWRGLLQSITLVRLNSLPTMGLVLVINLLMLGFRAVWGLIGNTPVGAIVAIVSNAYLATGMLLAVFVYYENLRSRWQAHTAGAANQQK